MVHDEHAPFRENIPAYAVGALDADEVAALESHLRMCASCQTELTEYRLVTTGLLHAVPAKTPSSELRLKLASRLPSQQTWIRNLMPNFFSQLSLGQVTSVALIVILLASNFYSNLQLRDLKQQQAVLAEQLRSEQAAIAMLAYPGTQTLAVTADVENLTGSMLIDKTQNTAVLFLWHLPLLDNTKTYQAWLIDANGKRISGGLFTAIATQGYTTVTIKSPLSMSNFVGVGVTIEPMGGSEKPTGPRVLIVNL